MKKFGLAVVLLVLVVIVMVAGCAKHEPTDPLVDHAFPIPAGTVLAVEDTDLYNLKYTSQYDYTPYLTYDLNKYQLHTDYIDPKKADRLPTTPLPSLPLSVTSPMLVEVKIIAKHPIVDLSPPSFAVTGSDGKKHIEQVPNFTLARSLTWKDASNNVIFDVPIQVYIKWEMP